MCDPGLIIGGITAAISMGTGIAQAQQQASAQQRANRIAWQHAINKRHYEHKALSVQMTQEAKQQAVNRSELVKRGIKARGSLISAMADKGVGGGVSAAMLRNLNLDESAQLDNLDVSARHSREAAQLKGIGSNLSAVHTIERLPEVPGTGLQIASSVIGGVSAGISSATTIGKAFDDDWTLKGAFDDAFGS